MLAPPVVEARRAFKGEAHRATHHANQAAYSVTCCCLLRPVDWHEVNDLADTTRGHEARDENRRVGEVQLLGHAARFVGGDLKVAAALAIEQRSEDTGRVKARAAEPVNGGIRG